MPNLQRMGGWLVAGLAVIAAIALVVGILGILVRYTSLGALIGLVDGVEKAQTISFKAGFKRGWGRLLRLFAIDLLLALAALAGVLVVLLAGAIGGFVAAGPLLLAGAHNGVLTALGIVWAVLLGLVVALVFIAAMVALGGLVTVVREYAYRACILELNRVGPSIRAGLALVRSRFRESLITWLMLVGINLALGIVAIPLSLLGVGGVLLPPMAMMGLTESAPAAVATAIPLLLLVAAVSVFLGGLYLVFQSSVWTLAYREITAPAAEPLPQVIATEQ
jgi:hypothetical protein